MAAPQSVHEITANWAGDPVPTEAPFGQPVTAEFHVNTNDNGDPYTNEPVENVRATLTVGNGAFTSIPQVCKTTGVTPISEISTDGTALLCNLGTITEGTASVIQAPVRATSTEGGDLTVVGTATSDSAVAEAGPADPGPLPITYSHGMDLSLVQAPASQGNLHESRLGGERPFLQMNYSLILDAGSRPGPESYAFPVSISANVAGATTGLAWEDCVPIGDTSKSTGQPYSDPTKPDRTNFATCAVSGTGANYTVSLSGLEYTLVNAPVNDSFDQPLPGNGVYIASGTVQFSIPAAVTEITTYTFTSTPGAFVFEDGVSQADGNAANNVSSGTLPPPGGFSNIWDGSPTHSRTKWDDNLWVSPGTSADLSMPQTGIDTQDDYDEALANGTLMRVPLYHQATSKVWTGYQGAGGAQMAGVCTLSQNPAFVMDGFEGGGWNNLVSGGSGYENYETARFFYTTQVLDTKTETCGEEAPSAKWIEVVPPAGDSLTDPRIASDILMDLPAGATGVKMTWNPAIDRADQSFVRAFGHIDPAAPTSGEGWTIGAFNAPYDLPERWPGYPTENNWINLSTVGGGTVIPGSTYGPNTNASRDAFRLQGAQGLIEKVVSDTTAQPGVPVTYTLRAQAQNIITSPPPATFDVVDTLPDGMVYVPDSGEPVPTSVSPDGRTITWTFTDVTPNVFQEISYQGQRPADSVIAPGTRLTNVAVINVVGDNRPANTAGRTARATVTVPSASATMFGKSTEANVLSFEGDSSAWVLTINSQDPVVNEFTDTIDILPAVGDGRGTNIDGTYAITGVDAPAGSTVYYTDAPFASVSGDPRDPSNGGTPGSVAGNTVDWSTTAIANPTAIRVIAPELVPGAMQTIRIEFTTPAGSSCEAPAAGDNKPGQIMVNSASSYAGHTALPMLSSAVTEIGSCYAANLKKYVQDSAGVWHDANTIADAPTFKVGDTIRYRIVVENIGQGTLTNVVVSDDLQPALGSFTIDSLARGESETHEFEIIADATMDENMVNTACADADAPPAPELPATINCDPAVVTLDGDPTHVKSLLSATPIGSGQWELVYGIDVTNTSTYSTVYNLDDTLRFTDQAEITSATVTASPADVTLAVPAWDGESNVTIATNAALLAADDAGYAPHHYEVTVVADVPLQLEGAGSGADDPTQCGAADGDDTDRAFNNTSQLTDRAGGIEDDQACAPIPSIDINKVVSAGPTPNEDGTWTVTYDVVATNTGAEAGVYDISDQMTTDGDLEVISGSVVSAPDGITPSATWTGLGAEGAEENVIATEVTLPAGGVHTYQVEVVIGLAEGTEGAPVITECSAEPGENGGLSNTAELEHNDLTDDASACITVGIVTVDKSISAGPTPNGDGTWTVVYDIVATHVGAAAADYDVTDRLHFGEGIEIVDAAVTTSPDGVTTNGDWTGLGAEDSDSENLVAKGVTLSEGGSHLYQVEVTVQMDEATMDPTELVCAPAGSGESGGLGNSTTLTSNGIVGQDDVCATLPFIELDKQVVEGSPIANGDGTWTIAYDVTATNNGQVVGDYDLSDRLRYGAGIEVQSAAVVSGPEGIETNAEWTGQGAKGADENVIVTGIALDAGEVHTYRVEVIASMDRAVVTPGDLICPAPGSDADGGFSNTAGLVHNGEDKDADACVSAPLIEITKSLSGAVTPVDGEDGVYDATYEITVTNSGAGAGVYNLDDQLAPGDGVSVVGIQGVTSDAVEPVAINGGFNGIDDLRIVTDQSIASGADAPVVHTYTVTVRYAADLAGIEVPAGDVCTTPEGAPLPGTLNNTATVGWNGLEGTDNECVIPGKPTLDKAIVSATPIGNGQWEVVYDLTVGNTGTEATTYDLDDELLFAKQITVDTITATGPDGIAINDGFDGDGDQRIATDVAIIGLDDDGYTPHVYTVTVVANVPLQFDGSDMGDDGTGSPACTVPGGSNLIEQGLNNAATLTDEAGGTIVDTDCAPVPSIDIVKAMDGAPIKGANGGWTVNYTITVQNDGAATGAYTVTDELRYGAGIEVLDATVVSAPEGVTPAATWTGLGETGTEDNVIATDVALAAGSTHTYQVKVEAKLDTDKADSTTLKCPAPGSNDRGGFANTAGVDHNDLTDEATACDVPEWPKDVPPPLAATGGTIALGTIGVALLLLMAGGLLLYMRRRKAAEAVAE
ncbi:DUF7507 domain-containing protein [Microbacterium sp. A84]|uniref:DUF7507 domain-containing protein n=1 Tax=Microbacterium sp. A84 TaxID=3450715 RepID=UPI003F4226D9